MTRAKMQARAGRCARLLGSSAVLFVLALAGCGDDDGGGGVGTGTQDSGPPRDAGGNDSGVDGSAGAPPRPPRAGSGGESGSAGSGGSAGGDDDASVPSCAALDCSHFTDPCNVGVCDPETVTCRAEPRADGTPCGDDTNDHCTAADSCQAGVCVPNDRPAGTPCGDQGVDCRVDDTCDGHGRCVDNGLKPAGSPCGDPTDDSCTDPDTCDGDGVCQPNHASEGTPCTELGQPLGTLCNHDDVCDGAGTCTDGGFWEPNQCPAGVPTTASGACICGSATVTTCHPAPDTCIAGACVINNAPDGTPCGDGSASECDQPDSCQSGLCATNYVELGTPCGDQTDGGGVTDTVCDRPDICDGFGQCDPRHADANTECGEAPGECFQNPRCTGSGACAEAFPAVPGTACGDQSDTACDNPDSCDGFGGCDDNPEPATTACGDAPVGPCDAQDFCDGSGGCEALFAPSGTVCGDADTDCHNPDTCDGSGSCVDNGFADEGTACGDASSSECDAPDSCDDSGTCLPNHVAPGTPCGGAPGTCELADTCGEGGVCTDNGFDTSCEVEVSGVVVTFGNAPIADATVEVMGSDPPGSAVTGADGAFTLTVPVGTDVLIRVHPTASHFGLVSAHRLTPSDTTLGALALLDDATAAAVLVAPGVATLDTSLGLLAVTLSGASDEGGESATIAPGCASSSCGPLVLDGSGNPVVSNTLLPGGPNDIIYMNLPASTRTVMPAGASGVNACAFTGDIVDWPILPHTMTMAVAHCAEL